MITFRITDAAERLAELIEEEETKLASATRKRDQHRAQTAIRAFKEALAIVLLERECKDGESHPMPDVNNYLKHRQPPPAA